MLPPKTNIQVLISPKFGVKAQYKKFIFDTLNYIKPKKTKESLYANTKRSTAHSVPNTHYYKYGHNLMPKVSFEDTDEDILKMLENIFLRQYA